MAYQRKTEDEWRIFADYGHGPEEVTASRSRKDARADLKAYRENAPEYAYTLSTHRVPKEQS